MENEKKTVVLVILDGFGWGPANTYNAVSTAHTPNFDAWWQAYPHAVLKASGKAVGLLEGNIGNSEVGHLTLGAGRVVQQPVAIVHEAIENGSFFTNPKLTKALKSLTGSLHLMGLLSDASVHSHIKHLEAFLQAAKQNNVSEVWVHPFLDGRDVPPLSAKKYLLQLETMFKKIGIGRIGSIHGRFYAMDRDNNWERTEKSYRVLTEKNSVTEKNWNELLEKSYAQNITDEFIEPTQLNSASVIQNDDGIIFFNFRPDRARQLTKMFIEKKTHPATSAPSSGSGQAPLLCDLSSVALAKEEGWKQSRREEPTINLKFFITPVSYKNGLPTTHLFEKEKIKNSLPDILHKHGKRLFAIAETEKYAHVTYFFSGGREEKLKTETRMLVPSIPAKNYVDSPCMSAKKITKHVLQSLQTDPHDFYLINYANADMVGHSGDMAATVKAVECLDKQIGKLYQQVIETMDGILIITADHGNAEKMFDEKINQPQTAHTTSPVPFVVIEKSKPKTKLNLKQLADVAPFVLQLMNLK